MTIVYIHIMRYIVKQLLSGGTAKQFRLIRDCEGLPILNTDRRNSESIRMSHDVSTVVIARHVKVFFGNAFVSAPRQSDAALRGASGS